VPERGEQPERALRAAALRYDQEGSSAPRVVAAGRGEIARRIVEEARAAGVPVRDDAALAEALSALELDTEVPEQLRAAVAEALVWAYRMDLGALREARRA
jgi:flagellar biosynthesis protein